VLDELPTEEKSSWHEHSVNIAASVVVFFIWHWSAFFAAKWSGGTEDRWFMGIVAMTVAIHLHKVKRK
jgi:hypothetical protein